MHFIAILYYASITDAMSYVSFASYFKWKITIKTMQKVVKMQAKEKALVARTRNGFNDDIEEYNGFDRSA